tara:strand:+ start:851 stop:1444 length:594 start_codon:yes stop_codon:yes gene_type:complete
MVKLNKIYTKTGDAGQTSLGDGSRIDKSSKVIVAVGCLDELNAFLGICIINSRGKNKVFLQKVQHDIFDLGADLIMPKNNKNKFSLRISKEHIVRLEKEIDSINKKIPSLNSFVLPGGSLGASNLHVARTICRRCELNIIKLNKIVPLNKLLLQYINRLSDYLFVLARLVNQATGEEILWEPGKNISKKRKSYGNKK